MHSLEDMFLNAPIGIYTSTPDGRFLSVNPAMVRSMGYDTAESTPGQGATFFVALPVRGPAGEGGEQS